MTFLRFTHHHPWAGLLLIVASMVTCGCLKDPLPAYGEVAILLSTDMSVPDAFDTLVLGQDGGKRWVFTAGATPGLKDSACGDLSNPDQSGLVFPSSLVLRSNREEPVASDFKLQACKGGVRVFERSFTIQMPAPGEQRMVRAPILWLCTDWTGRCFGCDEVPGSPEQRCFRKQIERQQSSNACETAACTEDSDKFYKSVAFRSSEVDLYNETSSQRNTCFNATNAFDPSKPSTTSVPTDWQSDPTDPTRKSCLGKVEGAEVNSLNLALVLPPGDLGVCNDTRCLVALEALNPVGWRELPKTSTSSGALVLPNAVCHLLDSGQVLEVIATTKVPPKGYTTPFCSMRNSTNLSPDKPPAGGKRYPLDDSREWAAKDRSSPAPALRAEVGTLEALTSKIAVSGTGAGRFTNKHYAFADSRLITNPMFTVSAWVSLTEEPGPDVSATDPMPIVSDIDRTCSTGARLQLRSNVERSEVVLELGLPTGSVPGSIDQCQLTWTCASFAGKSFVGGFFTPWNQGVWRHVAVVHSGTIPRLYLDGVPATSKACVEPTTFAAHDDSRFYLGSSRAELTSARTSNSLLIDELAIYYSALTDAAVHQQFLAPATVPGPSGLRWGAWGEQGSYASIDESKSPLLVTLTDLPNASAGTYANLVAPIDLDHADGAARVRDLSDFDEAVIVADLPPNKPFQFSLLADHGLRQCTWHFASKPASTPQFSDAVVIDLRRPSWCKDPKCSFDLGSVERASLGTDWKNVHGSLTYTIRALAFRKRRLADPSLMRSREIGGSRGPHGWCWHSISYVPQWDVAPVVAMDGGVYFPAPTFTNQPSESLLPEIAAEPFTNQSLGARDLTPCTFMQIEADWDPASPAAGWSANSEPEFVLKDDRSHTATFKLPKPQGALVDVRLDVDVLPSVIWPTAPTGQENLEYKRIRGSVTQLSIRSDQAILVRALRCCDSTGCRDLQ